MPLLNCDYWFVFSPLEQEVGPSNLCTLPQPVIACPCDFKINHLHFLEFLIKIGKIWLLGSNTQSWGFTEGEHCYPAQLLLVPHRTITVAGITNHKRLVCQALNKHFKGHYLMTPHNTPGKVGAIISPTLQMKKLRLAAVRSLTPGWQVMQSEL